jgi:hypothetical protein
VASIAQVAGGDDVASGAGEVVFLDQMGNPSVSASATVGQSSGSRAAIRLSASSRRPS